MSVLEISPIESHSTLHYLYGRQHACLPEYAHRRRQVQWLLLNSVFCIVYLYIYILLVVVIWTLYYFKANPIFINLGLIIITSLSAPPLSPRRMARTTLVNP